MLSAFGCRYFRRAFGWCVPIGGLAGLIGLGGGEFRLPVLMHAIGFDAKSAVPVNLMVSLVTLAFALAARSPAMSPFDVLAFWPAVLGLVAGGMVSAFFGAGLVRALTGPRLVQIIAALLAGLGLLLLAEAIWPFQGQGLIPADTLLAFATGVTLGLGIGLVSSLLGVAGGELLIPTMMFVFGADIRTAGTASILISLCLISTGLLRHWRLGTLPMGRGVQRMVTAMGAGSVIGAGLGGLAVAMAPVGALKLLLGTVLVAAAAKTMFGDHPPAKRSKP
ncbi:MAG: sulfite exporter TauE/SafE family protein [Rhodospirillaceae bacterium]|nr:sulfite exporter TauE/SafE family protein [Rhodospirillaceae bacterium]